VLRWRRSGVAWRVIGGVAVIYTIIGPVRTTWRCGPLIWIDAVDDDR